VAIARSTVELASHFLLRRVTDASCLHYSYTKQP